MSVIPKGFIDSVVAIGEETASGNANEKFWIGSGFIVSRKEETLPGKATFYIVTNKHVVKNKKRIYARFNDTGDSFVNDYPIDLYDNNGYALFSAHPDENTDIVAIQIIPNVLDEAKAVWNAFDLSDHTLTINQMMKTGVVEGSLVYNLGFPMNLVDIIKAPICRLGCISRFIDTYIRQNEHPTFLIDAHVFPGNSGGPVISRPEYISLRDTPNNTYANLIGIVSASILYKETLVSTQTGEPRMIQTENSGLTVVHPVDRIKEVVEIEWAKRKAIDELLQKSSAAKEQPDTYRSNYSNLH